MAENAQEIQQVAREFYERSAKFGEDLSKMGRGLNTAVNAYNAAVGSYDRRVIPAGRRLEDLRVADSSARKLESGNPIEGTARIPENTGSAEEE
jgi:DNA recombination protein RmuC